MPHPFAVGDRVRCGRAIHGDREFGVEGREYTVGGVGGVDGGYWFVAEGAGRRWSANRFIKLERAAPVAPAAPPVVEPVLEHMYEIWITCYQIDEDRPQARQHTTQRSADAFVQQVMDGGHRVLAKKYVTFRY